MNHNIFALAGLLHDIGKFAQRADSKGFRESEYLSAETKNLAGMICHTTKTGSFSHQHVLWTYEFIEKYQQKFKNAGLWELNNEALSNLVNIASYHHKPANNNHAVITLADHWSSGIDRNTERVIERNPAYGKYDEYKSKPLVSIFNKLSTENLPKGIQNAEFGYQVCRYNINETSFPKIIGGINNKTHYSNVWKQFELDFLTLPDGNSTNFIYSLFHLLKIYSWYIPASTVDYPDCSLFEHLKTTGAFAYCISSYLDTFPYAKKVENNNKITIMENHFPTLLVCGDISGIQNFIYNITNKNAMKSLKGRSFFIQLLTESIANEILDSCNATITNQVYAAGGKFYLLLPNTPEVINKLEMYKREIQLNLWDTYKGKLTCNISNIAFTMRNNKGILMACVEDSEEDMVSIGELWMKLAEKTAEEKRKKYTHIISEKFNEIFTPQGVGGKVDVCAITSEELTKNDTETENDENETEIKVSIQVKQQIELGQKMNNSFYLVESSYNKFKGFKPALHSVWDLVNNTGNTPRIEKYINIGGENFPKLIPDHTLDKNTAVGFKIFGGIENPTDTNNNLLTLEQLCTNRDSSEKLGVLRMDVDNLGNLFMKGFSEGEINNASFSAMATLSASLEHFFGGYINVIRRKDEFKNHVNIVYSGGDDVFAVGRWDKLILFAIEVRTKFKEFVCNRNDISISGGIAIINRKFPIAKGAEIAGEMEELAKSNVTKTGNIKDAITLFGIPLHWQEEMPFVIEFKNDLVTWLANNTISKGFLMKLFNFYELYKNEKEHPEWNWQCAYTIARHSKSAKGEKKEAFNLIKTLIFTNNYKNKYTGMNFDTIIAACRWAELESKTNKK